MEHREKTAADVYGNAGTGRVCKGRQPGDRCDQRDDFHDCGTAGSHVRSRRGLHGSRRLQFLLISQIPPSNGASNLKRRERRYLTLAAAVKGMYECITLAR